MKDSSGQESTIAEAHALLESGDLDTLITALPKLEGLVPANEPEWERLRDIFTFVKRPAWVEIITTRFLEVDLLNLNAKLEQTLQLSLAPNREAEAFTMLAPLLSEPYETTDQFFKLGTICMKCRRPELASIWFQKARQSDPYNVDLRFRLFWSFVFLPDTEQAQTELSEIRSMSDGNQARLIVLSETALQTGHTALATETFDAATALARVEGRAVPGLALLQAIRLARSRDIAELAVTNNLADLRVTGLDIAFKLIEGRGMLEIEKRIVATALELEPTNIDFQARRRSHASNAAGLFASVVEAPVQSSKQPVNLGYKLRRILRFR